MKKKKSSPRFPNTLLVLGVAVVIAGSVLLLWTLGYLPQMDHLWPVLAIVTGLLLLYQAYPRGGSSRWIIPGMVLAGGGIVFLLANTILKQEGLARIWPSFMLVTGLSLIPYGFKKRGAARTAIIIPAVFISALAIMFFPFSMGVAGGSFLDFVIHWWPLILIFLGIAFIASFFSTRRPSNKI